MSTSTSFKWVGPKQQRATQIPAAEWAKREDSRTQYIYQFGKWGLQKYGTAKVVAPRHLPSLLEVGTATASDSIKKRPRRSIQSIETSSSNSSSPVPPSKKVKVTDEDKVPYNSRHEIRSASSMSLSKPDTREAHLFNLEDRNDEDNAVCSSKSPTVDWPFCNSTETSFNVAPMNATSTEAQTSSRSGPGRSMTMTGPETSESQKASMSTQVLASGVYTALNDQYQYINEAVEEMYAARTFPPSMPRSLLYRTGPAPALLLSTADYLQAICNKDQAFFIYALLLQIEQNDDESSKKPQLLSPMALSCARTAETTSQRRFVSDVLLRRRRTLEYYDTGPSQAILHRTLLAQICSFKEQYAPADHPYGCIPKPAVDSDEFGDASFDVLAYLYHEHSLRETDPRFWNQDGAGGFSDDHVASVCNHGFILFVVDLRLLPGARSTPSSWDDPSTMVFDYVQSCIEWCAIAISVDCDLGRSFDTSQSAEEPSPTATSGGRESVALYDYFHRRWRDESIHWKWTKGSREALGISAAELLVTCCDMIAHISHDGPDHPHGQATHKYALIDGRLRKDLTKLQSQSHEELVTGFLRHLYLRITPIRRDPLVSRTTAPCPGMAFAVPPQAVAHQKTGYTNRQ
ncbi:hypothetical protein PG987_005932 [Apiospora arundinis]